MKKYSVISDSACDMSDNLVKQYGLHIVPFSISFDKTNKLTEGVDITKDDFYRRLEALSVMPKTFYPSVGDYTAEFKKHLEQGLDVLCLCLSSKLSKSYISAMNAMKILSYTYPNNKIRVIDTLLASAGQSLLAIDAVKLSESLDVASAFTRLEEIKKSAVMIVTVASLEQLARGGRMSNTTAALGKLLKINPIIYLENGALVSKEKAFGRKNAIEMIKKLTAKEIGGNPKNFDFAMLHSRALNEANSVANEILTEYGITQTIPPIELGATIGMHTGASVVSTALLKKL